MNVWLQNGVAGCIVNLRNGCRDHGSFRFCALLALFFSAAVRHMPRDFSYNKDERIVTGVLLSTLLHVVTCYRVSKSSKILSLALSGIQS